MVTYLIVPSEEHSPKATSSVGKHLENHSTLSHIIFAIILALIWLSIEISEKQYGKLIDQRKLNSKRVKD